MKEQEIIESFYFRHACKIFDKNKKISEDKFKIILEAARLSPSSFGFEPWHFLVVNDMKKREKLLSVTWGAQNILPTASHYVIILARKKPSLLYNSSYITHMLYEVHGFSKEKGEARRAKYKKFQEEDFKLLESERAIFDWACKQCYIALANMMSVAAMLKIDSCAVEGFEMDKIEKIMQDEFHIDTTLFGVAVMAGFGYRIKEPPKKTRQKLENIVTFLK